VKLDVSIAPSVPGPLPLPPPVRVPLVTLSEHPCPYLPGRTAASRAFLARRMSGAVYLQFMNAGFRRSGRMVYQPTCPGCRACVPIRVPVDRFRPSKSQRRCRRRNSDLVVHHAAPRATEEKFQLYRRYQLEWHDGSMGDDRESFEQFLYESPVDSLEFEYRDGGGRLLAVGICDICPGGLSSVYFCFDPSEARRGLGTFSALHEIEFARQNDMAHYYIGYWIDGCRTMQYKADFRPNELLQADGTWREHGGREHRGGD
jgi:leucyl-tRNA---protein transferase